MRNVLLRTASLCVAFLLLGNTHAPAQSVTPTPREAERAREALRAALEEKTNEPGPFDPHSAKTWNVEPPADIAPGLYGDLFQPSTDIPSVTADGDWLPGTKMPVHTAEQPQEHLAATPSGAPNQDIAEPLADLARPAPRPTYLVSPLRSGRASLDTKSAPRKKSQPQKNSRSRTGPAAPQAPVLVLPGELLP